MARLLSLVLILAAAHATRAQAVDSLSCTPFPFGAPRHTSERAPYDIRHLRLEGALDEEGTLAGFVELDVEFEVDAAYLPLFVPAMTIDSVRFGAVSLETDSIRGDTIWVALPDTVTAPSMAQFRVYHRTQLPVSSDGIVSGVDPFSTWFPSSPDVHDRFTADLEIAAPSHWSLETSGYVTGRRSAADGLQTYHHAIPDPLPARRIALVAGNVDAGTTYASLRSGRRPEVTWWKAPGAEPGPPGETSAVATSLLSTISEWTGFPYPFQHFVELHVPGPPATGAGVALLPLRVEPDDRPGTAYDVPPDLARPILQQWFGGVISAASWPHVWLEEAFPAYLTALAEPGSLEDRLAMLRISYLASHNGRPLVWERWNHPAELTDAASAARGAWILHMLRQSAGEDAFREAVARFLSQHAFEAVATNDWLDALAAAGIDARAFADVWIYGAGHPQLRVSYAPAGNELQVSIEQIQEGDLVPSVFPLDLTLEIGMLGDTRRFDVRMRARTESFLLPFGGTPRYVAVDPDGRWLLDAAVDQPAPAWVAQLRQGMGLRARLDAAHALADEPQDPALLLGLRAALEAEPDTSVRAAILTALGALPPSAAAERVIASAYDDPSPVVRIAALRALGKASSTSAAAETALRAAETDNDYGVQAEAVRALAAMDADIALDVARAALITPSHDDVIRAAGLAALGLLDAAPDADVLEAALLHAASDQPLALRRAAIRLLANLPGRAAENRLVELLADPSVAADAVDALSGSDRLDVLADHLDAISDAAARARATVQLACR